MLALVSLDEATDMSQSDKTTIYASANNFADEQTRPSTTEIWKVWFCLKGQELLSNILSFCCFC